MFDRIGRWTASHPWMILSAWLILCVTVALVAPKWDSQAQDDDIRFVPDRFTSVRAYQVLEEAFPNEVSASNLIIVVEREDNPLTESDFALVDRLVNDLRELRENEPDFEIREILSYRHHVIGSRLLSRDQQCTIIQVCLSSPHLASKTRNAVNRADEIVQQRVRSFGADAPNVYATGAAGLGRDLTNATVTSLDNTTWATIVLVVIVLLLVYRAPLLALVPLFTIGLSVFVSLKVLALLTLIPGVHLVNISKIFVIVILYGAGTDYCLFLVSRYREELRNGNKRVEAIGRSVGGVGGALAASAATVMVGLALMAMAEFAKVRYAGPAIALSLGIALIACLTLTPAVLRILGKRVFWPFRPPSAPRLRLVNRNIHVERGFWNWVSHRVVEHPIVTWSIAMAILLPLMFIGMRTPTTYRATGELPPSADSLQGLSALERHFNPGEIGPITVLLTSHVDWKSREGKWHIDHLSRGFKKLPNIAEIRSMTQPLGFRLPDLHVDPNDRGLINRIVKLIEPHYRDVKKRMIGKGLNHYVAEVPASANDGTAKTKYVTRIDLVMNTSPFDEKSKDTLALVQTWLKNEMPNSSFVTGEIEADVYGVTAKAHDLAQLINNDRTRVNWLVIGAIFLILLAIVRHPWMAAYLLITVMFSYLASLGATVLVCGWCSGGPPLTHLEWRVPFFLFIILVAVGEDYNILLMSRAMEERKRHGVVEGVRRALARTGGVITSCGIIMAGTFATLMLAGLGTLLQIGFALAFGVLVDTFIVRPFLVPAAAVLFWRDKKSIPVIANMSNSDATDEVLPMRRVA